MNKVLLIGRITKAIELRYTQSGMAIVKFTLAINRETKKDETDFINCVAYGKTAELISKYLDKGNQLAVEGRITTGSYEKDGKKVYTTDVLVERIQFIETKKKEELTDTEIIQKAMNEQVEAEFEMPF